VTGQETHFQLLLDRKRVSIGNEREGPWCEKVDVSDGTAAEASFMQVIATPPRSQAVFFGAFYACSPIRAFDRARCSQEL